MRSVTKLTNWGCCLLTLVVLNSALAMAAASYRGVEVGQRGDLLPPDFDEAATGLYEARFGNELVQVFVEGALVTGMKIVPQATQTLAEALATHSPGVQPSDLTQIQDWNGFTIAIADRPNRIAYFTRTVQADSIVTAVGYYSEQTALMLFTIPLPERTAVQLIAEAKRSRVDALQQRPAMPEPENQAAYLVDRLTEQARTQAQREARELSAYARLCTNTSACESMRRQRARILAQSTAQFLSALTLAERAYDANASWLGNMQPENLSDLVDLSDDLVRQIRAVLARVQSSTRGSTKSTAPESPAGRQ